MIGLVSRVARIIGRPGVPSPVALPPGVSLRHATLVPRIAGWLAGMKGPAAAVTLGRTILLDPHARVSGRLIRHELAHVRQWEREPNAFPFRYIASHIRHGYGDNPFEAEARAAETEQRAAGAEE